MTSPTSPSVSVPVSIPQDAPVVPALSPGERLAPTCAATAVVVLLGDFLFWSHEVGLSLGLFVLGLAGLLVARNWSVARTPRVGITLLLLLLGASQSVIETSFTNIAVLLALLAILLAELRYLHLPAGWARWSESLVAWASGLGRWLWLVRALNEQPMAAAKGKPVAQRLGRLLGMALPATILLTVFIVIFSMGNRIFHQFFNQTVNHFSDWLGHFDFSPARVIFWLLLATVGLAFIRPRNGADVQRFWARPLAEWRRPDAAMAFWQSALILFALNILFFAVNTIDVVFLWQRAAPPEGVLPRDYLYAGVYSLITATVLAGIVLTFIFQQPVKVTGARSLRWLALAWIAQNFVLIAGVFLRLKLFLDLADMTEKRVYVACFLLLVAVGFALLCRHVVRGRLAGELIWRNVVATFGLFFVLQFLNVAGWVAQQNVAWSVSGTENKGINVPYNMNLGPGSWPALIEAVGRMPGGAARNELILDLRERARRESIRLPTLNWRERQLRRDRNAAALIAWAARWGKLTEEEQHSAAVEQMDATERSLRPSD